jgi:hypothetical protein
MINHVDILDPVSVEIKDSHFVKGTNYKTIEIKDGTSSLELFVSDKNYVALVTKAVSELCFGDKLDLLNQLAEEDEGIYDIENPEFKMSEINYNPEEDKVYAYWEEEK